MDPRGDGEEPAVPVSPSSLVREFHETMGIPAPPEPDESRLNDPRFVRKVNSMLASEVKEVKVEMKDRNLEGIGRELADIVYSAFGAALELGIDLDERIREVHQANLSRRSPDGQIQRTRDGKIQKGPSYEPPWLQR